MKILLAHNNYNITGGAEVFYHEVGRVLEENGHEVAYFSVQNDKNPNNSWSDYFPKAADYKQGNILQKIIGFPKMAYSWEAKNKFKRLLQDFKPDLVHVFAIYTKLTPSILDACREAGVPIIMSCNDYKHICPNYKLFHHGHLCYDCKGGNFYKAAINRCSKDSLVFSIASSIEAYVHNYLNIYKKNIDTFLFASEFMAHKTEEFWGKNTFKWEILKNPYNSSAHSMHEEYNDYILYFGRLIDEKGVNILVQAMAKIPTTHLKVVGDGPDMEKLQELGKKLNLNNIEFVGAKWGKELDEFLYKARFVVIPSIWHENFPYVILQSFAAGKAVVGTNRGGIPELIRDGEFGYIYPAHDHDKLAGIIIKLWDNPELSISMGRAAKQWVDSEFNDEKFYSNLMNIYNEVLQ